MCCQTKRHRQTTNLRLFFEQAEETNEVFVWSFSAPARGIQQLVAIRSWREKRFHCERIIKGNLEFLRLMKYNKPNNWAVMGNR